jgi:hypothetical protein
MNQLPECEIRAFHEQFRFGYSHLAAVSLSRGYRHVLVFDHGLRFLYCPLYIGSYLSQQDIQTG